MSTKRLTRSQREDIIINHINGKDTPGYKVIENANGKFTVKVIKESKPIEAPKPKINSSDDDLESLKQPVKRRTKQDARELLQQLSQLLNEDEPEQQAQGQYIEKRYKPGPQSWKRKKLIF